MRIRRLLIAALAVLGFAAEAGIADDAYRFEGVARVVAFGDVHGAYDGLTELLGELGVIDGDGRWAGGETHLVSVGDLVHRGDHGKQVLELLMRLEREAETAGGRVHLVLGNHEVMAMTGDERYVSAGDYAQFGGVDERRAAFAPDGDHGSWLLTKPVIIVIDGTAFVHGGLSGVLAGRTLVDVNESARRDIRAVAEARVRHPDATFRALAEDPALRAPFAGLPFDPDGPLWYRGTSLCHPYAEGEALRAALAALDADRVAVGHTVTVDRRIASRMGGRALRMDVGMNADVYGGRPAALVIEGGRLSAHYLGEGSAEVVAEPNRVWARPYSMTDAEIEEFLRTAEIVGDVEVGTGVTRPRRLTLTQDGRTMHAAFKTVDTDPRLPERRWRREFDFADRYVYEVAAYRLDRLLGFDILPVAVLRTVDGQEGALVYWLEGTINENERIAQRLGFGGHCDVRQQVGLMNVFHVLIHNLDPNLGNILYDTATWQLWAIDHSRAFGTQRGIPRAVRDGHLLLTDETRDALARVTPEALTVLAPYLHRRQIRALVDRAADLRRR